MLFIYASMLITATQIGKGRRVGISASTGTPESEIS